MTLSLGKQRFNALIPRLPVVTGIVLVVAVLSLAGLAYQTIPMSTTLRVTQESTEAGLSYSPYFVASTTTSINADTWSYGNDMATYCPYPYVSPWPNYNNGCYEYPAGYTYYTFETHTWNVQTSIQTQWYTATVPYSQTATSSITESSTSIVPAYSSVGLTGAAFGTLSILVIGILALVTGWFALKSKISHRPKQATMSQFMKVDTDATRLSTKTAEGKRLCIECGNELHPNLKFCDSCGTKQPT